MKTLYIHIGTPKTATTAIQSFCNDNQEALNKNSFCYPLFSFRYPNVGELRNAYFLHGYIYDKDGNFDEERRSQVVKEGLEQIYECFKDYDNVILSDEGIWNAGLKWDERLWKKLKEEQERENFQVKLIVYFRRQDEFLYSWWNQQIKEGMLKNSKRSWDTVVEMIPVIQLHYYQNLERIANYVKKENIIVRIFDRSKFVGGTIYADFMDAIGLDFTEEYQIKDEVVNISYTKNACAIKRTINNLPELDAKTNELFRKWMRIISQQDSSKDNTSMFSKEEWQQFMSDYTEENKLLAKEYLDIEEDLFDNTYNADGKWVANNDQMQEDMIRLIGMVAIRQMEESKKLRKEIKENRKMLETLKYKLKHPVKTVKNRIIKSNK